MYSTIVITWSSHVITSLGSPCWAPMVPCLGFQVAGVAVLPPGPGAVPHGAVALLRAPGARIGDISRHHGIRKPSWLERLGLVALLLVWFGLVWLWFWFGLVWFVGLLVCEFVSWLRCWIADGFGLMVVLLVDWFVWLVCWLSFHCKSLVQLQSD